MIRQVDPRPRWADERVGIAFRNCPRFVVRGVDYGDVIRLSHSVLESDDWLPAWTDVADEQAALPREWEAEGSARSAGQAWNRAALGYHFGRFLSVRDPAAYHACSERAVAAPREAHPPGRRDRRASRGPPRRRADSGYPIPNEVIVTS